MRASSPSLRVLTSLRLGERVLVRSDDGLLAAEYALFDVNDIVLRATDPVSVREVGYMTTARDALARLSRAGVTSSLALEAARTIAPAVAESFARGMTVRSVVSRLTAYEIFEGAVFSAATQSYEGAWLDLDALAAGLGFSTAPILLQVFHLTMALSEVAPATPVHLSTAGATRERRPGERTHARVPLESAAGMPDALRRLAPRTDPIQTDAATERRLRQVLLARLRERATTDNSPGLRGHLAALEGALGTRTTQLGPLADSDLRAIERKLASGDARGVEEQLDQLERSRGRIPGIRYLRARAALLRGDEAPRSVAQLLSELAQEEEGFHEAELGAARTWLAAGENAHARFFAHRLADDEAAPESERLVALEILDETTGTSRSHIPPPVTSRDSPSSPDASPYRQYAPPLTRMPNVPQASPQFVANFGGQPGPRFPSLGDMPPPNAIPKMPSISPESFSTSGPAPPAAKAGGRTRSRTGINDRYDPELVESLSLPPGATEGGLNQNDLPRTPLQARIATTRLSRDLGRDYRLWYGKALRCNVLTVDAMQQHLAHRYAGASISDERVAWELRRHGALLSEILARALGGAWVDIGPTEPGFWAMSVPPTRCWPIGRVYRFIALGTQERDLVSYYLDLETRVRSANG